MYGILDICVPVCRFVRSTHSSLHRDETAASRCCGCTARWGEASWRGAVWVQGRCIVELCEPCFVSLCLFIAGEELFQSFREPAAKLHFLPRPCSRREASQPNGGRACQAACAPAWVTHTHTHTHTTRWAVTPTHIDQSVIWTGQIDFCLCF